MDNDSPYCIRCCPHVLYCRDLVYGQDFDTDIVATERVEIEMMRKENEALKGEKGELVKDRQKICEDKEALER